MREGQVTLFASFGAGLEEVRVKEVRARLAIKIATAAISEAQGMHFLSTTLAKRRLLWF